MSTIINAECVDQELIITNSPVIASGGIHENFVAFKFCSKWDGLGKTAVFYRNEKEQYCSVLDANNVCEIPHEVTDTEGTFYFGVFGVSDDTTKTSKVLKYKVTQGSKTESLNSSSEPTPDIYQQILSAYGTTNDAIEKEVSERKASILAEETARKQADSTEKAERQAEIAVERARINALTKMEPGSTMGDAELQDIRIGADGVTYETAGASVRAQVTNIKSDLSKRLGSVVSRNLFDENTVKLGYYLANGTPNFNASLGLCVSDFIEVEPGEVYAVAPVWNVCSYDENKAYIQEEKTCFVTTATTRYIRITVAEADIDRCIVVKSYYATPYTKHGEKIDMDNISTPFSELNIFNKDYVVNGYLGANGKVASSTAYATTEYIYGSVGDIFTLNNYFNAAIYNSDYSFSRMADYHTFKLENNERFFRVTFNVSDFYKASIQKAIGYVEEKRGYKYTTVYVGANRVFTTINSALDAITDNNELNRYTLLLDAGTYNETITTKHYVDIVGVNKYKCIIDYISDDESDYVNRSAIFAESITTLKNLTVKTTGSKYPLHCDGSVGVEYRVICINCIFQHNGFTGTQVAGTAVGIGLYHGQHIELYECECIASGATGASAIYCHNQNGTNERQSAYRSLKVEKCILENCTYGLRLQALETNDLQDNDCFLINVKNNGQTKILSQHDVKDSWHIFEIE